MNGLDWLEACELHPDLSDDAKTVAVFLADGWTGPGARCRKGLQYVLDFSPFTNFGDIEAAAGELRAAGFLTGRGTSAKVWKLHDPGERLPFLAQLRAEEKARAEAAELDRKLKMLGNGGQA